MSNSKWGCCVPEYGNNDNFILCINCKKKYHYACMSLDEISFSTERRANWYCPECNRNTPKGSKKDSTPISNVTNVRGSKRQALTSPPMQASKNVTRDDILDAVQEAMGQHMQDFMSKMQGTIATLFDKELKPIKDELLEIKESMNFINNQYEDIKSENEDYKRKIIELETQNKVLNATVNDLNNRVNQIEQHSRQNNVELQCVPEHINENLVSIVNELGKTVGCILKDGDILHCTRAAKLNRTSPRPRSIIVQLASPKLRDMLLASTIKFNKGKLPENKLNSTLLGVSGKPTPVYVAEHLSPTNKTLHAAARTKAKGIGFKYVWVRNGKIFMRRSDETDYVLVKNMDHLKNIN